MRDSSPAEDIDVFGLESEAPTKVDPDDFIVVGGKRVPLNSDNPRYAALQNASTILIFYLSRSLKRTKTYSSFNEVRPTIRNKPSGLVNNWPRILAKPGPAPHRRVSPLTPSTPSSSTPSSSTQVFSATPSPLTPYWQPQPSPITPNSDSFDLSFDSFMSAPDTTTPFPSQPPSPFDQYLSMQSYQPINDPPWQTFQAFPAPTAVRRLPS